MSDKLYKWPEWSQKTAYLPDKTLQMIGVTAENSLPACQALQKPEKLQKTHSSLKTLQMTRVAAESRLHAWQTLQMAGVTAENRLLAKQALQITGVTAEECFPAW